MVQILLTFTDIMLVLIFNMAAAAIMDIEKWQISTFRNVKNNHFNLHTRPIVASRI